MPTPLSRTVRARSLRAIVGLGLAGVVAFALAACSIPDTDQAEPLPTPTVTMPAPSGDGVLKLGTMFATFGDDAAVSATKIAAVELAVRDINESGGVLGAPVQVFHRTVGGTADATAAAFAELQGKGVDIVLGGTTLTAAADPSIAVVSDLASEPNDAFSARLKSSDPSLTDFRYGAEAYDAVISVAMAAASAGDDGGPSIVAALATSTADGVPCASFGECEAVTAADFVPAYATISQNVALVSASSDEAMFGLYIFDPATGPVLAVAAAPAN